MGKNWNPCALLVEMQNVTLLWKREYSSDLSKRDILSYVTIQIYLDDIIVIK